MREFKTIPEAFEAGRKVGFVMGFHKATQIVIDNCKKMQERVPLKNQEGGGK